MTSPRTIWQNISDITDQTTLGDIELILRQLPVRTVLLVDRDLKVFTVSLRTQWPSTTDHATIETMKVSSSLSVAIEATLIEHIAKLAAVL